MEPKKPIKLARPSVTPVRRRKAPQPSSSSMVPVIIMSVIFLSILGAVVIKNTRPQNPAPNANEIALAAPPAPVALPDAPKKPLASQIRKQRESTAEHESQPLPSPAPLVVAAAETPKVEAEIPKIDAEKMFFEYRQEELVKLPRPVLGQEVDVFYSNGDVMRQTPVAVDDDRGVVKIKMAYGSAEVHYSSFTRPCAEGYIPRLKAERIAQKRVSENLATFIESTKAARKSSSSATVRNKNSSDPAVYFLPIPDTTSEDLLHAEGEMQAYLRAQALRSGQSFSIIHSSLEDDAAIVYLEVGAAFGRHNAGTRYQMAEGLRQFWGLRCMGNGITSDVNAYLVLVANGKIIGGSKVKQATSIWVR